MTALLQMTPETTVTHRMGTSVEGMMAGFGLIRHSDGRLPDVTRRQRRINRQRRLN